MKQLLSSFFALCSSAVLASSFALFAPGAAQASFTLIDDDNDMLIDGIAGLEIDGSLFNVDFVTGFASEVYSDADGFSFDNYSDSAGALDTVLSALGGARFEDQNGSADSILRLGYSFSSSTTIFNSISYAYIANDDFRRDYTFQDRFIRRWVSLEAVAPGSGGGDDTDRATTPEPSLIIGFITLSGLMLGSKRKTKG